MNLKKIVWISSKSDFKWTWRKRWCSTMSDSKKLSNMDLNVDVLKKLKNPESMFVHKNDVARDISNTICKHLTDKYGKEKLTLIEVNPGPCLITKHILEKTNYNICLYVNNYTAFETFLNKMNSVYGNRISIDKGNVLLLWKYGFQDRMDMGDRVSTLLSNIRKPCPWNHKNPSLQMIAVLPNRKFLNYLIYSFIFQTGLMTYGRPEFYFLLPPSIFTKYACEPTDIKYYKTQTILFKTIFDIELIEKYPRASFFPPHSSKSGSKNVRFKEVKEEDDKCMVLAKMVGRRDIFEDSGLTEDLLKPYWYFVKHHTMSRSNCVIPMLEQWIPGCGPHFIAQGYTIFTQFGDLNPPQILQIFLKFISLPEFKHSPFLNTMEDRIAKLLPILQITSDNSTDQQSKNDSHLDSEQTDTKGH